MSIQEARRPAFEAWIIPTLGFSFRSSTNNPQTPESAHALGKECISRCKGLPEKYSIPCVQSAWEGWNAALDSALVQRPWQNPYANTLGDYPKGYRQGVRDMIDCIEEAGLKVSPLTRVLP